MIEDHVEKDLKAIVMQVLDERFEFVDLHTKFAGSGITSFGSKEAHLAVAPIIQQLLPCFRVQAAVFELIELEDGHQLDAIDTKLLQVGDFLAKSGKGTWVLNPRGRMLCKPANVHLVDNHVLGGYFQGAVGLPVEIVE